jgi:hypothetical protein
MTGNALEAPSHDQQTLHVGQEGVGELLQRLVLLEDLLDLTRKRMQAQYDLAVPFRERDAVFGELKRHHQQRDVLRGVCLAKGHQQLNRSGNAD